MRTIATFRLISTSILFSMLLSAGIAQEQKSTSLTASTPPLVTATVKGRQLRFAALGEVRDVRLEVFDAFGLKVFDSSFRSSNSLK